MMLRLIPEILDLINVIASVGEELGMVDSHVMKVAHVESIVGLKRVRVNNVVGSHFFLDDRQQSLRPCVGRNVIENLPAPWRKPNAATCPGAPLPPHEVTFIRFDFPAQLVTGKLTWNEATKAHEKTDCCVAMDANDFGGNPGGCPSYEHLQQIHLLMCAESTSSCIHLTILFLLLSEDGALIDYLTCCLTMNNKYMYRSRVLGANSGLY